MIPGRSLPPTRGIPPTRYAREFEGNDRPRESAVTVPPILLLGWSAGRWGFVRTRQLGPALVIASLAVLAASAGGPTVKALLDAWAAANDLLNSPRPDRIP